MIVKRTAQGPKKAPTAPMSFTSPNPSASFFTIFEKTNPISQRNTKPKASPPSDQQSAGRRAVSPCSSGTR